MKCIKFVRDKKTGELRRCGNCAVQDSMCNTHHPHAIERRLRQKIAHASKKKKYWFGVTTERR